MIFFFLAFLTGVFIVIQMYLNSQISSKINSFNGVLYNYLVAVIILLAYFIVKSDSFIYGLDHLVKAPIWSYLGAAIGVTIVATCNFSFSRFPPTYVTSAIIFGQLSMALIIDRILGIDIPIKSIIGIFIIGLGIISNSYVDSQRKY